MDKFEETISSIKEKVGEENSALISDDIITLMTEHKSLTEQNEANVKEIETLKSDKNDLLGVNAKLFQRLGFEDNEKMTFSGQNKTQQNDEPEEIKIGDIINVKGDII